EVVPEAVAGIHPEDQVETSLRPPLGGLVAGGCPEPVQQRARARGVVHAGDPRPPAFASFVVLAHRTGVDRESQCAGPGSLHWTRQRGELPQQGASEATISFTSKSAAAMRESAAP